MMLSLSLVVVALLSCCCRCHGVGVVIVMWCSRDFDCGDLISMALLVAVMLSWR